MWAVVGGISATLLGVLLGAILTGRSQDSSWTRDRQLEAYAALIREGTRAQVGLRNEFKHRSHRVDWMPWNEALAMISLVGSPDLVQLSQEMDAAMWRASTAVACGRVTTDEEWDEFREALELTRLTFINAARRDIAKDATVIERLVSRPPLKEMRTQLSEATSE